jgi:hypothetical protein
MQCVREHFNLACSEFRVLRARASAAHLALNRDAVLDAQVAGALYQRRIDRRVKHHLNQACAVAQVYEHQSAQVADAMHPAVQAYRLPDMLWAQNAALVRPLPSRLHTRARLYPLGTRVSGTIFPAQGARHYGYLSQRRFEGAGSRDYRARREFHTRQMLEYGTKVVAGVTPGKGGQEVAGVPVFDTVKQAVRETGANVSCIFVPAPFAPDAILEAADAGIELIVCITEGIPVQDMVRVMSYIKRCTNSCVIGPTAPE